MAQWLALFILYLYTVLLRSGCGAVVSIVHIIFIHSVTEEWLWRSG